jgi:translation initiation factor IF-3
MYIITRESNIKKLRLVTGNREAPRDVDLSEALNMADEQELDLICVSEKDDMIVAKIDDYSKMLYEKQKREKENRKKARLNSQELKEIQISNVIAEHDLLTKAKNASRILGNGDKVKLVITYKGRSIKLIGQGESKLYELTDKIETKFNVERAPKIEGNRVTMILSPMK